MKNPLRKNPFVIFAQGLIVLMSASLLVSCSKKGGDSGTLQPLDYNSSTLSGAWQVESVTGTNPSVQSVIGYQLEVTGNNWNLSFVRGSELTYFLASTYLLQNNKVVTTPLLSSSTKIDFEIVSLTQSTLQMRPIFDNGGTPLVSADVWNFKRIDVSNLIKNTDASKGASFKYLEMDIQTAQLRFTKRYASYQGQGQRNADVELNCKYAPERQLVSISLKSTRAAMTPRQRGQITEAEVSMRGRVALNLSAFGETALLTLRDDGDQQKVPAFTANFTPPRSKEIFFSLNRRSLCQIQISHNASVMRFEGSCDNVNAFGLDLEKSARIQIKGQCDLEVSSPGQGRERRS